MNAEDVQTLYDKAACRGHSPQLFDLFAHTAGVAETFEGRNARYNSAVEQFCNHCPVKTSCFELAAEKKYGGVWGGALFEGGHPRKLPIKKRG